MLLARRARRRDVPVLWSVALITVAFVIVAPVIGVVFGKDSAAAIAELMLGPTLVSTAVGE